MTLVFDTGALVALERNDRAMWTRMKIATLDGHPPLTHGGVVGQVWRGGSGRQAVLAKAFDSTEVVALTEGLGRTAGVLLAIAGLDDVVDASIVAIARDGDQIITSDPSDIGRLVQAAGLRVDVVSV